MYYNYWTLLASVIGARVKALSVKIKNKLFV